MHSFTIISTSLICIRWQNYPGAKFQTENGKFTVACSRSPQKLNSVVSRCRFAENDKEMYQTVQGTCRAIVLLIKTYCFVTFSLPLPSRFRKVPFKQGA